MCLKKLPASQYAQQQVVRTFGELIFDFNEQGTTHISRALLYSVGIKGIGFDVNRCITGGILPFEQFGEERHWTYGKEW